MKGVNATPNAAAPSPFGIMPNCLGNKTGFLVSLSKIDEISF
jgi:hypothetical protein